MPVGVVGPLVVDGKSFRIPMATTEGALVASTNRGCRAIELSGGASSVIMGVGMTRAPLLRGPSLVRAAALKKWIETPENAVQLAAAFNSTTRYVSDFVRAINHCLSLTLLVILWAMSCPSDFVGSGSFAMSKCTWLGATLSFVSRASLGMPWA